MKIYFSPLACSFATRISLYEAAAEATLIEVDPKTKRTSDDADFRSISPLGMVPALVTERGDLLTENAAILQYLTELYPKLQPRADDALERARLKQWLSFIGTELHKALYVPLLDPKAPDAVKQWALQKMEPRLSWVAQRLEGREFLLDGFSVADAYLFAVLNWSSVTPVPLAPYPSIIEYQSRLRARPSVVRAFAEERELYSQELVRHRAA